MGVQGEVEVPPQLLDGAATPVLKHVQVDTAAELRGWGGVSVRQRPGLPSPARLTVQGHSPRWPLSHPRVRGCVAWPRGLVCFSGLARVHIQMHTRMYMHTHTHTLPALPTQEGGWSAPPRQGGLRGRTEWREGGVRLGFSRFGPFPFGLMEEGMATHSSILAWKIPRTEEPGGLQSMELQRVRHD